MGNEVTGTKGMRRAGKIRLVLACVMLISMFMYQGWYSPDRPDAATTAQSGWAAVGAHTANLSQTVSYSVAAGPGRLLLVGVTSKLTGAASQTITTATYGGVPLVEAVSDKATSAQVHTYLFYLTDNAVMDGTAKNIVISLSGGTAAMTDVYATVYNGIDQTTPITDAKNVIVTSNTAVALANPGLTVNAGDQAVALYNIIRSGSTSAPSISSFGTPASWSITGAPTQSSTTSPANRTYALSRLVQTAGPDTLGTTVNNASDITSLSALSIKAATNAPTITSVTNQDGTTPATLLVGSTQNFTINGTNLTGAVVTISGTLVTASNVNVAPDGNSLTVDLAADASATIGTRTITVTTPVALTSANLTGFLMTGQPPPTVTSMSPNVLGQGGAALNVTITGDNFVSGTGLAATFGTGVTVNSTTFVDSQHLTANVTVTTSATVGVHNIIVTNPDSQSGTGTGLLTVDARATVTQISPVSGVQGAAQNVTITGTGFVNGPGLAATFSGAAPNITVNSTSFVDTAHIIANITIDPAAAIGTRTITVTNGDFGTTAASGTLFQVVAPGVLAITTISPIAVGQNATGVPVNIYGAGFDPAAAVIFSSSRVSSVTTTFVDSTHLIATINTNTSSAQASNVTVTNPGPVAYTATSAFSITNRPTISSVSPASGLVGNGFDLSFVGTNFQDGATVAFTTGTGVTVSNVVVASAILITAHIDIDPFAAAGLQTITITNPDYGNNSVSFNVYSPTAPTLTSVTPVIIGQGATNVNLAVNGTNYVNGATVAFSGTGITVNSVTVVDASNLIANVTAATSATTGARNITITNPDKELTIGTGVLTVSALPGALTLNPAFARLGTTMDVAITGSGFINAAPLGVAVSGDGVTVNSVTYNSATSLTANITIDPDYTVAPLGARTLTVTNGDYGTRTATFTVRGLGPTFSSAAPSSVGVGVTRDIIISGTNFYPGVTVAFSGTGVTVNSVTLVDAGTIRTNVTVSLSATAGARNVTVTNVDTQAATGTGAFTVNAAPTVASVTPLQGGAGVLNQDLTIYGTGFENGATTSFGGPGIIVTSVDYTSVTSLTAHIAITSTNLRGTGINLIISNPDGAVSIPFPIALPTSTTPGAMIFPMVTSDTITVRVGFLNDSDNDGSCTINWGTAFGSYPNTATVSKNALNCTATVTGLSGGGDGEGIPYYFQATFNDPDGITGNAQITGVQSTKASVLMHNGQNLASVKWPQGWGVQEGKYGAFTCTTCHNVNTSNARIVGSTVTSPSLENWSSIGNRNTLSVKYRQEMGNDTAHQTSTEVCEVCHSRTDHHRYNNPAANHNGNTDCTACHSHGVGFALDSAGGQLCTVCHASLNSGAFHHDLSSTASCLNCHADHNIFRSDLNEANNVGRAANLRVDAAVAPAPGIPGTTYTNTDFNAAATNGGLCVSCHLRPQIKPDTTITATVAKADFAASGHNYAASSTFQRDYSTFLANCSKCHTDDAAKKAQSAGNQFSTHGSTVADILAPMGATAPTASGICIRCHSQVTDAVSGTPKPVAGKDYYAAVTMSTYAEGVFGMFQKTGSTHNQVQCIYCHNPHVAASDVHTVGANTAGPPLKGATGVKLAAYPDFWNAPASGNFTAVAAINTNSDLEAYVCFKCHSASAGALAASPSGGFTMTDTAREFNPNNVGNYGGSWTTGATAGSFHPVLATAGSNLGAVSLGNLVTTNYGWSTTSRNLMTCSDCHGSDTTTDPSGPHGSAAKFLLKGPNTKWDATLTTTASGMPAGTFCANCHSATFANSRWITTGTTSGHVSHHTGIACFNCHVAIPHGSQRPGLLMATFGAGPNTPAAAVTDSAPYNQSTTGSKPYIISYPTNNTTGWIRGNCACNSTSTH
jgi:IPT/TIG domain